MSSNESSSATLAGVPAEEAAVHDRSVDALRIAALYEHAPKVLAANLVNAGVVTAVLWSRVESATLLTWFFAMAAMVAVRGVLGTRFRSGGPPAETVRWARRFTIGSLASGLLWGGGALLLFTPGDPAPQVLLAFVLGGMGAGASSSVASHLPAFYAFLVPALLPLSIRFAAQDGAFHWGMAAMLGLFGLLVTMIGRTTNSTLVKSYRLSLVNESLVRRLGDAHHELEDANVALEARVEVRTRELQEQRRGREEAEKRLHQAQRLQAVGQLSGGIAHEFNNLLTVVVNSLEVIDAEPEAEGLPELVRQAKDAALRGGDLTRSLLAFSRREPVRSEVVVVGEAVERLTSTIVGATLPESIVLELAGLDSPSCAAVDPALLEAAVLNLVLNARDSMLDCGTLTISVRLRPIEGEPPLGDGMYAEITVDDTGVGIEAETLERVLEPFFTTKAEGGTGLGLSMVYGFAEQSGGAIQIESTPGVGTCARLLLPQVDAAPASAGSRRNAVPAGHGETILLVEDDPFVRTLTVRSLKSLGYKTLQAESADAALELLAVHAEVALVMTDVVMPGSMDGLALAREVGAHYPHLPVVLASGYSDVPTDPESQHCLAKPYQRAELATTLADALTG